jgi:hypothetical protein
MSNVSVLKELENELVNGFGVGILTGHIEAILAAADRCSDPYQALTQVNQIRAKHQIDLIEIPYWISEEAV